jgi:hypothetical protein
LFISVTGDVMRGKQAKILSNDNLGDLHRPRQGYEPERGFDPTLYTDLTIPTRDDEDDDDSFRDRFCSGRISMIGRASSLQIAGEWIDIGKG